MTGPIDDDGEEPDDAPGTGPEAEDDGAPEGIPPVVMAVLRDRMHARRLSDPDDLGHIEVGLGTGDEIVYVVDDGADHCMIGRPIGATSDGSVYVLVGRISLYGYEQLRDGETALEDAFTDGRDISVCAVFQEGDVVANIALVRHFRHADQVPAEYLPGHPYLEFADEDSPTDEE